MYYQRGKPTGLYDPQFESDSCGVGFVVDIKGRKSSGTIRSGLEVLRRLSHRGAVGADPRTGDGAGILIQIPHEFLKKASGLRLPSPGEYGAGLVFLPADPEKREASKKTIEKIIRQEKQVLIGWRDVPTDDSVIGEGARKTRPGMEQVFIARNKKLKDQLHFERKLYLIRKQIEKEFRSQELYVTNLSSRTLSYKGLLMPGQVEDFFPDLKSDEMKSAIALVHSRYSTNTFPTWDLAQPFRFLAHNGEINTLRGNVNWMRARESELKSELFGSDIKKLKPVIVPGGSDSAAIDNMLELLVLAGRSLPHAMMMLIPSAWEKNKQMNRKLKAFYKYHACFMEPWDGPAAIAFTDGTRVGAVLDRNGLRPARYIVTKDDMVVMASEVGVLDIPPEDVERSGRLEPGKIFYIDTGEGRIIHDEEVKRTVSNLYPYEQWVEDNLSMIDDLPLPEADKKKITDLIPSLAAFGYTREDLKMIIRPMAQDGIEPVGSMGNDTPHAVLSSKPQLIYNYFRQLFAQVTNPPIDPIREESVMSAISFIGVHRNILEESPEHCGKIRLKEPILTDENLLRLKKISAKGYSTKTISLLYRAGRKDLFKKRIDRICDEAKEAIKDGYTFIILSDRGVDENFAAIPALLATGAVHHCLVSNSIRGKIGIIVESGEPREVHHFALLFAFGADSVNPYLAFETIRLLLKDGDVDLPKGIALKNFRVAAEKGIKKIISKMGISTLRSYRGAQIFEALGLSDEVIDKCFAGTISRVGGATFDALAEETDLRHKAAFSSGAASQSDLETGGIYQWKKDGEFHLWNPESIAALQDSVRSDDYEKFKKFVRLINNPPYPTTLRNLLKLRKAKPIPLDEVEPAGEIFKRFATGAMSYGSISRGAHETIAVAMNRIGGRSNTGEGGEDPERFHPLPNGDSKRSAIKQVASGRFGVTANYLANADEIQIKIAQGAKPGEGGQLPGHKVSAVIAKTRYTTPGVTLISPPPHHDIYSIEDLAQLIFDLKNANPKARISVKLVSEPGVGTVAAGVAKGHADMILISGGDGGTGASPRSSIRHAGLPWELGLAETHQTLVLNNLRSRVRLQTDGQIRTGKDIAVAAILGAEEFGFATTLLIVMGCVMLRHCHLNNCSVGVATQDEVLEKRFRGKADEVVRFFRFLALNLREVMADLGVRKIEDLIGRTDLLEVDESLLPRKAKGLDFSKMLCKPDVPKSVGLFKTVEQDHKIDGVLDRKLIKLGGKGNIKISNSDRSVGAMLSNSVISVHGEGGLPDDAMHFKFNGVAGQSFGAFLAHGITFELEGLANDYIGKGISGGKIIVYPDKRSDFDPQENIVIGNTTFYGAISGEAYIRGRAGERFCIRNSGVDAVVEGVGDHGCEYMTGGRVVVIGETGRNFAAGMSGGIAYVYAEPKVFWDRCNKDMVEIEKLDSEDKETVLRLLTNHYRYTGSPVAKKILNDFYKESRNFIKVIPIEYKRVLEGKNIEKNLGLDEVSDG